MFNGTSSNIVYKCGLCGVTIRNIRSKLLESIHWEITMRLHYKFRFYCCLCLLFSCSGFVLLYSAALSLCIFFGMWHECVFLWVFWYGFRLLNKIDLWEQRALSTWSQVHCAFLKNTLPAVCSGIASCHHENSTETLCAVVTYDKLLSVENNTEPSVITLLLLQSDVSRWWVHRRHLCDNFHSTARKLSLDQLINTQVLVFVWVCLHFQYATTGYSSFISAGVNGLN